MQQCAAEMQKLKPQKRPVPSLDRQERKAVVAQWYQWVHSFVKLRKPVFGLEDGSTVNIDSLLLSSDLIGSGHIQAEVSGLRFDPQSLRFTQAIVT